MTTYRVTAHLPDGSKVDLQPYTGEGFDTPDDNRNLAMLTQFGPVKGYYVQQLKDLGYAANVAVQAEIKAVAVD